MGTNYYLRKKVTLKEYLKTHLEDFNYGNTLDILFNGYVFNKTYYASEEELNEVLYLELHIGKSSAGWHFGLCIYPELGINNLEDWKREFNNPENEIIDEYWINPEDIINPEKMIDIITNRKDSRYVNDEEELLKNFNGLQRMLGGKIYNSYDEILRDNEAERGLNGLWAHRPGNPYTKYTRTDGTYDLTPVWNFS